MSPVNCFPVPDLSSTSDPQRSHKAQKLAPRHSQRLHDHTKKSSISPLPRQRQQSQISTHSESPHETLDNPPFNEPPTDPSDTEADDDLVLTSLMTSRSSPLLSPLQPPHKPQSRSRSPEEPPKCHRSCSSSIEAHHSSSPRSPSQLSQDRKSVV